MSKEFSEVKQAIREQKVGLEPTRLTAPESKSGASTNFATSAFIFALPNSHVEVWLNPTFWPTELCHYLTY